MKKFLKISGLVTLLLLVVTGCGSQLIMNLQNNPVEVKKGTTSDEIYKAIRIATLSKGWKIKKISEGVAQATLNLRTHQAVVRINYDDKSYSINYVSSINLNSNGIKIHSNYNGWIAYLKQSIDYAISGLSK
jgi:hypothetical protein